MAVNKKNNKDNKELIQEENNISEYNHETMVKEPETSFLGNKKNNGDLCNNNNNFFNKYKTAILIALIISILTLIVMFFPRIKLDGSLFMEISYNEKYIEPGYHGYMFKKNISNDIKIVSNINNGILGNYEINYYINLFGAKVKKTRNIKIVDNVNPLISIEHEVIKVCPNQEISDIKYSATDEFDGDLTSYVLKEEKDDKVLLTVKDFSNNQTSLEIKIDRTDNEKPTLKLKGNSVIYLTYGNVYSEPGYTSTDNCGGDLTNKVVVSGNVGRDIGTYHLKYEVTDDSGNTTSITRKIIIDAKITDNGSINKGAVYLTFDDGPNYGTTDKILDILKEEGIRATFFVTSKGPDHLIRRMYDEGHTVALHTATHNYSYIYSSVDNYFKDLNQVSDRVKGITGVDSKIIRFPGGSSNTISRNYNTGIMTQLTNIVLSQGYRYFDWNIDAMDASSARNSNDVYYNVTSHLSFDRANVVLMHDTKNITVGALRDIIKFGKTYGYNFNKIDMDTYMVRHTVNN